MATVDARPVIAGGGEPSGTITAGAAALGDDEKVVVVLAPFEPVPLEGVLGSPGSSYETADLGGGSRWPAEGGLAQLQAVNAAWNALTYVYDPGMCLDVVSLGLVYDVRAENSTLVVEMTLTTPDCPAAESLRGRARAAVAAAIGDGMAVDMRIVWEPPWSPAMIDSIAAEAVGLRVR